MKHYTKQVLERKGRPTVRNYKNFGIIFVKIDSQRQNVV